MESRCMLIALLAAFALPSGLAQAPESSPQYGEGDQYQDPQRHLHHWEIYQYLRSQSLDLDHDIYFQALQQRPLFKGHGQGFRIGFRAGYEDGRVDLEDGRERHFGYRFRYPDQYRLEFGSRDDYLREYREGYEQGYRYGYVQQS